MRGIVVLLMVVTLGLLVMPSVKAEGLVLSDKQIESIRLACDESQSALARLKTADTLMRVGLGQRYENISIRLMAPLNSRMALNNLDIVGFATTTTAYTKDLKTFSQNYKDYIGTVEEAIKINCKEKPIEYYALIERARVARAKLHQDTITLNQSVKAYRDLVVELEEQKESK